MTCIVSLAMLSLPRRNVDKRYIPSRGTRGNYIDKLNRLIEGKVEFVHPQPDTEVKVISENRERIQATTFLSSEKTIEICPNKPTVNELLLGNNVPVPQLILLKNGGP